MPRTRTYGLDNDTLAYAARVKAGSGKTILPENLKQINRFVVGIKKLGLWNSMVCWPMRSIHNAGTGSTVYSLGKSGEYNGTLVNAPTWNVSGIRSTGLGSPPPYIQLANTRKVLYTQRSIIGVFNSTTDTTDNIILLTGSYSFSFTQAGEGFNFGSATSHRLYQWGEAQNFKQISQNNVSSNVFNFVTTTFNSGNIAVFSNGGNKQTESGVKNVLTDQNSIRCMAMQGGSVGDRGLNGVLSLVIDMDISMDDSQQLLVYSLYRNTLGKGLNLPY
jgi:hypothetical protein